MEAHRDTRVADPREAELRKRSDPAYEIQTHTKDLGKFSKSYHVAWDLGLFREFNLNDWLVYACMNRYTDFKTRACSVFPSVILRETGLRWPKQVERSQGKFVKLGIYKRKGFKKVGSVSVRLYYQASGEEILQHAEDRGQIEGWLRKKYLRAHNCAVEVEAAACGGAVEGGFEPISRESLYSLCKRLR